MPAEIATTSSLRPGIPVGRGPYPSPQHQTIPVFVTAQLKPSPRASWCTTPLSPLTSSGCVLKQLSMQPGSPLPISPCSLRPQHIASPRVVTAQLCVLPRAIELTPPMAVLGSGESVLSPVPSCPWWFAPQQRTKPSADSAHVWSSPAATALGVPLKPSTSTGFGVAVNPNSSTLPSPSSP